MTGDEHHHLFVTRAEAGEAVEIFNGAGHVWQGVVEQLGKREAVVRIESEFDVPPPPVELILGFAIIRAAPLEWAIEKAVEVGVTRIVPFTTRQSNAPAPRRDRWQRIVVESAKQSKRYHLPRVESVLAFEDALTIPAKSRLMFSEHGGKPLKSVALESPVLYLIGPEGGWTPEEISRAAAAGFVPVYLGPHILRAETAAIVGAALLLHEIDRIH